MNKCWIIFLFTPALWAQSSEDVADTRLLTHFDRFLITTQEPIVNRLKGTAYEWQVEQAYNEKILAPLSPLENDPRQEAMSSHYRNQVGRALGRAIGRDFEVLGKRVFTRTNTNVDLREYDDVTSVQNEDTVEKSYIEQGIDEITNFQLKTSISTSRTLVRLNYDWLKLAGEYRYDGVSKLSASKNLFFEITCHYSYLISHAQNQLTFSRPMTDQITAHLILQDEATQNFSENIFKLDYIYSF